MLVTNLHIEPGEIGGALAFGLATAVVGSSRGRNALVWFVIGFFLPCIGLVLVLALPDLRAEGIRQEQLALEHERLHEHLKKDRQLADRRHLATAQRLDAHDRALDLDTAPVAAAEPAPALPADAPGAAPADWTATEWWYLIDRQQQGPVAFAELKRLWRAGKLGAATHVWREGMAGWQTLGDLPALEAAFRA